MNTTKFTPVVFVPVFNGEKAINFVFYDIYKNIPKSIDVFFLDNDSSDETLAILQNLISKHSLANFKILKNPNNLGLGGSQKKAFHTAKALGYSHLVIFHGDGQPSGRDLKDFIELARVIKSEAILGSRFMGGSKRPGYSKVRTIGNLVFNCIFSLILRKRIYDIGSGLNLYKLSVERLIEDLPDDLSFNSYLLVHQIRAHESIIWSPIEWRNSKAGSNVKILSIGIQCLLALRRKA